MEQKPADARAAPSASAPIDMVTETPPSPKRPRDPSSDNKVSQSATTFDPVWPERQSGTTGNLPTAPASACQSLAHPTTPMGRWLKSVDCWPRLPSSAASHPHSYEFIQSNPSRQSGMVQPVVNEMFATVHAAGSSLLGLFTSCTTFDSTGPPLRLGANLGVVALAALGVVVDGKEFVLASELAALADDVVNRTEDSVDLDRGGACVPNELFAGRVDEPVGGVDLAFLAVSLNHLEADAFARVVEVGKVDPVGDGFVVNFDDEMGGGVR
eukprot:scaffold5291_cov129-Isochrysis_galbana.AAC.6